MGALLSAQEATGGRGWHEKPGVVGEVESKTRDWIGAQPYQADPGGFKTRAEAGREEKEEKGRETVVGT